MAAYTIQRRTQETHGQQEEFYVVVDQARRVVDEFETIEAARASIKYLPE